MRRPKEVTIIGHRVRILPLADQGDEKIVGFSSTTQETILISPTLPDGVWDEILIHEVLHYISDTLGKELTEDQIKGMSSELFAMGVRIR